MQHKFSFAATLTRDAALLILQVAATFLCLFVALKLWRTDLSVPFFYQGDTIYELALVKSIASGGWIWSIDRLGAPFGFLSVNFPQNMTFSSLLMKLIALFTTDAAFILNTFWLFAVCMTSVSANISLRALGISRSVSFGIALLYSLIPYAFYRNITHISLTFIFVPVIMAKAIEALGSDPKEESKHCTPGIPTWLLCIAMCGIGFDYIYNAFFSCFFLAISMTAASLFWRNWQPVRNLLPIIMAICAFSALNLAPSLLSWYENGVPPGMFYKNPAEAEVYGMKIRHMISPAFSDFLSPPGLIYPLENENTSARLGIVGSIGFLISLLYAIFLKRIDKSNLCWAAGTLALIGTLVATIGGFGSVFNLLASPEIRAYNRIITFIAFSAFFIVAYLLDQCLPKVRSYFFARSRRKFGNLLSAFILALVVGLGLTDQMNLGFIRVLVSQYDDDKQAADDERLITRQIEHDFPHVSRIYQLPETPFPSDPGREKMGAYDHGRPYIWSQRTSWSWPAFSLKHAHWQDKIEIAGSLPHITNLIASGFDGIWLDRFGYTQQQLDSLDRKLSKEVGKASISSSSGRYVFFDLTPLKSAWIANTPSVTQVSVSSQLLDTPIALQFGQGFYGREQSPENGNTYYWSLDNSKLTILNTSSGKISFYFHAKIHATPGSTINIYYSNQKLTLTLPDTGIINLDLPMKLAPHTRLGVAFTFNGPKINYSPKEERALYFSLINPFVE